ncbi:hypothetical protein RBU60_06130 [Mesonia sp. MT50]|uniref:DUF6705 domain-containing protein n=1 Tax=Mesonia profundi TaxID=3070998 RepID=A0ABU1A0C3_9FLAO|nr:DUF6705 family protein [Mesonia profundi]MDQ7917147.1 hypothetical protein [Mesonia profundi]
MRLMLLFLIIAVVSCKAQTLPSPQNIIPVEQQIINRNNEIEVPDNTYYKDINNLFDKYIGVWTGNYNNKSYEFVISKINKSFLGITVDELIIKYKITDNNGNILVNTTNLPDDDLLVIEGDYLDENGETYHLYYIGENYKCGQNGYITMAVVNNGTQLNFGLSVEGEMTQSCQTGPAEQIFPEFMTLNKQ